MHVRCSGILVVAMLLPAWAMASPGDQDGSDGVAALLADEKITDPPDLLPNRERWAMRDLLTTGFMRSLEAEARVHEALDPLRVLRERDFMRVLEREAALAQLRPLAEHEAARAMARGQVDYDIPIVDHALVDSYIDYFTGRGRWFFARWLERSTRYIPMMQPILVQHGLPKDIVYLAMIESGFSSRATSIAAAAGFWQFIRSTGKLFGMKTDTWVDERRDFVTATHAAARYLTRLYAEFGDWHLAWASYNGGEGRVRRALARTGASDFWELVQRGALPKETQHYVPKIIAAAIVAKNAEHYGFDRKAVLAPLTYDELTVSDSVDLRLLAHELGAAPELLRELNPELVYDITPPNRRLRLRVPQGTREHAAKWLENLPQGQRFSYNHHVVGRGDTLSGIAKRFGTSIALVQELNDIKSARSLRPGQQLIIPSLKRLHDAPTTVSIATKRAAASKERHPANASPTMNETHVVAAGETLWAISRRYKASVDALKRWNGLKGNEVRAGAVLKVKGDG